jgi:hypothetical protein
LTYPLLLLPAWEFVSDWWINSGGVVRAMMDIPASADERYRF